MALYSYQSLSKMGKKVSGFLDASSLPDAKTKLSAKGLYVISISATDDYSASKSWLKRLLEGGEIGRAHV